MNTDRYKYVTSINITYKRLSNLLKYISERIIMEII